MKALEHQPEVTFLRDEEGNILLASSGEWRVATLKGVIPVLDRHLRNLSRRSLRWDLFGISSIDSAGMVLIEYHLNLLAKKGNTVEVTGASQEQQQLYEMVASYISAVPDVPQERESRFLRPFTHLGESVMVFLRDINAFLSFVGENFVVLVLLLLQPWKFRYRAIIKNIQDAGVRALPIITLTSFLIGVVIAYQGAVQLQKFGANIFVVDMIGISVTRELAPLITAIVVAGRTGSSYTAQIGVMKITQEIDAMRIMGFEPHRFLVLPRVIAVMIALPLMIFFADIIGIAGGMLVANLHLNISMTEFIHRLQGVLDVKHVWIGVAKGPFFAWLIAMTGCFRGFQVSRDTESIGRYTTISVVNAIFLVIACDALFSVILTELGI
ncbi:MAG TPA: MlaE family lipid ABC transporter permease subunit [Thiolapillus brandeum]|uniref:MlaE family lipid ABC transporter permease subunit n=1 Tax=Thiolapillus brandeum TaxID=1076588 RepID=A0A831RU22_9GAMM|nr:MlaE family lipid ABC transporter permease subunit [Thiolapillus brandeum]